MVEEDSDFLRAGLGWRPPTDQWSPCSPQGCQGEQQPVPGEGMAPPMPIPPGTRPSPVSRGRVTALSRYIILLLVDLGLYLIERVVLRQHQQDIPALQDGSAVRHHEIFVSGDEDNQEVIGQS